MEQTHYVVRNRNGKFVRAFVNEWQARNWVAEKVAGASIYAIEPRNSQGGFDKIRKAN